MVICPQTQLCRDLRHLHRSAFLSLSVGLIFPFFSRSTPGLNFAMLPLSRFLLAFLGGRDRLSRRCFRMSTLRSLTDKNYSVNIRLVSSSTLLLWAETLSYIYPHVIYLANTAVEEYLQWTRIHTSPRAPLAGCPHTNYCSCHLTPKWVWEGRFPRLEIWRTTSYRLRVTSVLAKPSSSSSNKGIFYTIDEQASSINEIHTTSQRIS